MKKHSSNFRIAVIIWAVIALVFASAQTYVSTNNHFPVTHFSATPSTEGPDGRAAVGGAEMYHIEISPKLAHHLNPWAHGAVICGFILLALTGLYLIGAATDLYYLDKGAPIWILVGLMVLTAVALFAAYSSILASNYKEVSPEVYLKYKDHLQDLFTGNLIR